MLGGCAEENHGVLPTHWLLTNVYKSHAQNPAFGPAQVRELTEIFVAKAIEASRLDGHLILFSKLRSVARRLECPDI